MGHVKIIGTIFDPTSAAALHAVEELGKDTNKGLEHFTPCQLQHWIF